MPRIAAGVLEELPDVKWPYAAPCWWVARCYDCKEELLYGTKRVKGRDYPENITGVFAKEEPDLMLGALCYRCHKKRQEEEHMQKIQDQCG